MLSRGLWFRIGDGSRVNAWLDPWLPSLENFKPSPRDDIVVLNWDLKVQDLTNRASGGWNATLIQNLFDRGSAFAILQLPPPCVCGSGEGEQEVDYESAIFC